MFNLIRNFKNYLLFIFLNCLFLNNLTAQDTRKYDWVLIHGINSSPEMWDGSAVRNTIPQDFKNNSTPLQAGYDPTKPIDQQAVEIKPQIQGRPGDETIIIAHSMGGLATRSFLQQFGQGKVSTIITLGTPHLGAHITTEPGMGNAEALVVDFLDHGINGTKDIINFAFSPNSHWRWWEIFSFILGYLEEEFNIHDGLQYLDPIILAFAGKSLPFVFDMLIDVGIDAEDQESGITMRPGSTFMTQLNANQANESRTFRFAIRGFEDYPQMYRLFGAKAFGDEEAILKFIESVRFAALAEIAWTIDDMNRYVGLIFNFLNDYYFYNDLAEQYWEAGMPNWAMYYWDIANSALNQANFYDYEYQIADNFHSLLLGRYNILTGIPVRWNEDVLLDGEHENDAIVSSISQKWPGIPDVNVRDAIGANHTEEKNHIEVIDHLRDIAAEQGFNKGSPVRPVTTPSGLSAQALDHSHIQLSWSDSPNFPNENGFKIEMKVGTQWTQIGTVGSNATVYTADDLGTSTTYSFRVRAHQGGRNSDYSGTASATTSWAATISGSFVLGFRLQGDRDVDSQSIRRKLPMAVSV